MEKNNRKLYVPDRHYPTKHISPSPTLTTGNNPNVLSTQMKCLKLNKSENRATSDKDMNSSDFDRYEANDEAFIEFSTLEDQNTFNKSYSNMNILGDLDDGYFNRDEDRFGKKGRNEQESDILGQLDFLLESSMPSQNDIDVRGITESYVDRNNDMAGFAEELMLDSVDKNIMLEPMSDIRKMVQTYMRKVKDQMSNTNMKTLTLIEKIIDLLHRNECRSGSERKKILGLFEEIQANGGLPKIVEKEAVQKYPDMVSFIAPKSEKDYVIF